MIAKKTTFMKKHMLKNTYVAISNLTLEDYEYVDEILDSLKYAYQQDKEDYLMNILNDWEIKEFIEISKNFDIFRSY